MLVVQFLWSDLLAHASHNLSVAAADWVKCGNNCLSLLVGCFDVCSIPSRGSNRVVRRLCQHVGHRHGVNVRYMLLLICSEFHEPQSVRLVSGKT